MGVPTTPEDYEDLSEYKFQKFAATYFQGTFTHQYSKKPLKHSLLPLQTQGDQLVSFEFSITIAKISALCDKNMSKRKSIISSNLI